MSSKAFPLLILAVIFLIALAIYGIGAMYVYIQISQGKPVNGASWMGPVLATFYCVLLLFALVVAIIAGMNWNFMEKLKRTLARLGYKGKNIYKAVTRAAKQSPDKADWLSGEDDGNLTFSSNEDPGNDMVFEAKPARSPPRQRASGIRLAQVEEPTPRDKINTVLSRSQCPQGAAETLKKLADMGLVTINTN